MSTTTKSAAPGPYAGLADSERRFQAAIDANGNPAPIEEPRSPFSSREIELMRRYPIKLDELRKHRPRDFAEHRAFMKLKGPQIEQALGVSAEAIFKRGDSAQGSKLMAQSPENYRFLREYSNFI